MCVIIKIINKRNRIFVEKKSRIFALISIDIYDFFSIFKLEYEFFLKIINNYSRRVWILFLRKRFDAFVALFKWKLKIKLQFFAKLQIVRNDNAKKLKFTLNEWYEFIDIISKYIIVYNSNQNDVTKRNIKIIENQVKIMFQNIDLFLKFWLEIIDFDIYIRNRVIIEFVIKNELINLMKIFTTIKFFVDYLRVWNCKYYFFVNTKFLSNNARIDKFVNREKFDVFMSYDENIIDYYRIWVLDRQKIIKHHKIVFSKHETWENEFLNLKIITSNILFAKRFVNRSRIVFVVLVVSKIVFDSMIIEFSKMISTKTNWQVFNIENQNFEQFFEKKYVNNDSFEIDELIVESSMQTRVKLITFTTSFTTSFKSMQQFLYIVILKRKKNFIDVEKRDEHRDKIARVMLAFLTQKFDVNETKKWVLIVAKNKNVKKFIDKLVIFIFENYEQIIRDSI